MPFTKPPDSAPPNVLANSIARGDAIEIVIFTVTLDALVDFRLVRNHSFDQRLGKFPHVRFHRTKFPKVVHSFGSLAVLKIAPEVILDGRFPRASPFAHITYLCATSRSHSRFRLQPEPPRCRD